jgi:chemotaxis protein CheX
MHPTQSADVKSLIAVTLHGVFEGMLALNVEPSPEEIGPRGGELVVGTVGIGGENVAGAIFLHVTDLFARKISAAMLGIPLSEVGGEAEVNDAVSEVTNMLAGGVKSRLCDSGSPCAISAPSIIRGNSFVVDTAPDIICEKLHFRCETDHFMIELHLKIN